MGASVKIEVHDQDVVRAFSRLLSVGQNPRRVLAEMGRYGKASTQLRFRDQRGPDYVRWKPSRRAVREGGQTLADTSRLRNSLTWQFLPDGVELGTNVEYAAAHQFGVDETQTVKAHFRRPPGIRIKGRKTRVYKTTRAGTQITYQVRSFSRRMKLPARPFLGVNEADRIRLLGILKTEFIRVTGRPM